MKVRMNSNLYEKIAFLYPEDTDRVYETLQMVFNKYRLPLSSVAKPQPNGSSYSERDAILIAYADHVQSPNEPTLQTAQAFFKAYVQEIFSTVHFLPFYPYSSDDGFAVVDYYKVEPSFGSWDDVAQIGRDFTLMFDFVANHVSQSSVWFQQFLAGDPQYQHYFLSYKDSIDSSAVYRPRTTPLLSQFETKQGPRYVWTTFSNDQIDLNYNHPDVFLALADVLLFYIANGASTIRFDAVGYLWKDPLTASAHLPQTHMLIKLFRQIIDEVAPHVRLLVQANTRQDINTMYFGNGTDETHLVYNFALPSLLLHTFVAKDTKKLAAWLDELPYPADAVTYVNITATHDGIGLQPLKGILSNEEVTALVDHVVRQGAKVNYRTVSGVVREPYEINATYRSAIGSVEAFIASQAIQLALRGIPAVYFASLFGEENWLEGVEKLKNNRAINRKKFRYSELQADITDSDSSRHMVYAAYHRLLTVRRAEPLFSPVAQQQVVFLDARVCAIVRSHQDATLLALTNVTADTVALHNLDHVLGRSAAVDILTDRQTQLTNIIVMQPYETLWLK
jgi:glucosylglycerate phosphorylase